MDSKMKRSNESPIWEKEVDCEAMLNKYGPEGCCEIAGKLIKIAKEDTQSAMDQSQKELSDDYIKQETTGDMRKDCSRFIEEIEKNNK